MIQRHRWSITLAVSLVACFLVLQEVAVRRAQALSNDTYQELDTFANVLAVLKRHGINVEEVTNTVFEGGVAACAKLRMLQRPTEACLAEIKAFEEVLHVDLVTLPMLA